MHHDSVHERCFSKATGFKPKGLGKISRFRITFFPNSSPSLKALLPLPSWFLPLQQVYSLWPLPYSGHLQVTPSEASPALKDGCLLARA